MTVKFYTQNLDDDCLLSGLDVSLDVSNHSSSVSSLSVLTISFKQYLVVFLRLPLKPYTT